MKDKIKDYLTNNTDEMMDIVLELNAWNGCLDYLDFAPMDFFD